MLHCSSYGKYKEKHLHTHEHVLVQISRLDIVATVSKGEKNMNN